MNNGQLNAKILVVGNLGYIGPVVVSHLRKSFPDSVLIGFDIGYFEHSLTTSKSSPEIRLNTQHYGDVRNFPNEIINDTNARTAYFGDEFKIN